MVLLIVRKQICCFSPDNATYRDNSQVERKYTFLQVAPVYEEALRGTKASLIQPSGSRVKSTLLQFNHSQLQQLSGRARGIPSPLPISTPCFFLMSKFY
jgi:hypothetical protein